MARKENYRGAHPTKNPQLPNVHGKPASPIRNPRIGK